MFEDAVPPLSNFPNKNISHVNTGDSEWTGVAHAIFMASILIGENSDYVGACPDATLVCAGNDIINSTTIESIELLFDENINILNLSLSFSTNTTATADYYDFIAQYLDYIVYSQNIVVCISSGNYRGVYGVHNGAMSYNSIVVGNLDDKLTLSLDDDELDPTSLYSLREDVAIKPDLSAPGDKVGTNLLIASDEGGTSSACAVTSGICALLMDANPQLIGKPMLVKSILLTSAKRLPNMDSVESTSDYFRPAISREYGAGMIDAMQAYNIATGTNKWFYYSNPAITNSNESYGPNITITQNEIIRDKKLIVSFCWNQNVNYVNSNTQVLQDYCHAIEIYDPNGTRVAYSVTPYDTKEFIYYTPTVPGTYQIRVIKLGNNNDGGAIGALSYRIGY